MIRGILALVAIGWLLVNAAGLVMALLAREPIHAGIHLLLVVALGTAAWLLRPWRRKKATALPEPPAADALVDEIDRLQRELDETRRRRDFAEELFGRKDRPDAH